MIEIVVGNPEWPILGLGMAVLTMCACASGDAPRDARVVGDIGGDIARDADASVGVDAGFDVDASEVGPSRCDDRDAGARADVDYRALVDEARANAELARPLVRRSSEWLTVERTHVDADNSGLLRDTLYAPIAWSTQDTAADIYPFFAWSAFLLDRPVFDVQARRMLMVERDNTVPGVSGLLPYSFDLRPPWRRFEQPVGDLLFGAAEYVKDGLTPIVELTGRGPWSDRMQEIELDSFRYGQWSTPAGLLPTNNLEVNGDHMQSLPRLYAMTRDTRYRDLAERIAQHYFVNNTYLANDLRDHGCEIIGGFSLLYAVERQLGSTRVALYETKLGAMLDDIVAYGLTPDGLMHDRAHRGAPPGPVEAAEGTLSDNWGQNYVAFLIYAELANRPEYFEHVDHALRGIANGRYENYPWMVGNIDGLADSMEGAIYLLAYRRVPEAERWVDRQAAMHLATRPWPPDKYGANANRTAILYARSKTRGAWVHPWREDVSWGAAERSGTVVVSVSAGSAWSGRIVFDSPRHRDTMGFTRDHPRMNYLPEYFVAEPCARYRVTRLDTGAPPEDVTGAGLIEGYALALAAGARVSVMVQRLP